MGRISNIILAHDQDPRIVRTCVEASLNQDFDDFEIILVNNSTESSQIYGKKWEGDKVKTIHTGNLSRGQARNNGVYAANGTLLVFLDADTFMCGRNHFSKIAECGESFSHGYGAKRFWTYPPAQFQSEIEIYRQAISEGDFDWILDEKRAILPKGLDRTSGYRDLKEFTFLANFGFIKKNLFEKIDGFNSNFNDYGGEDDYLAYSCYREDPLGFKLLQDLSVLHVNHPVPNLGVEWGNGNLGYEQFHKLVKKEGYSAFNINVLFGIPDGENEPVLERSKK